MECFTNNFRARLSLALSPLVKCLDFFSREPKRNDLRRLSTSTWPPTTALLQLCNVVTGFSLGYPRSNLLIGNWNPVDRLICLHGNNV